MEQSFITINGLPTIKIIPSKAWGSGDHETTLLCLQAMGYLFKKRMPIKKVLDFGAGSGILGIGAALSGAKVEAVEIDVASIECAIENSKLNGVEPLIDYHTKLTEPPRHFDLVVANILKEVLLEFADSLCTRLSPNGYMVLSGLVATDVPAILACYKPLLTSMHPEIYERGEWRAIMFQPET